MILTLNQFDSNYCTGFYLRIQLWSETGFSLLDMAHECINNVPIPLNCAYHYYLPVLHVLCMLTQKSGGCLTVLCRQMTALHNKFSLGPFRVSLPIWCSRCQKSADISNLLSLKRLIRTYTLTMAKPLKWFVQHFRASTVPRCNLNLSIKYLQGVHWIFPGGKQYFRTSP